MVRGNLHERSIQLCGGGFGNPVVDRETANVIINNVSSIEVIYKFANRPN